MSQKNDGYWDRDPLKDKRYDNKVLVNATFIGASVTVFTLLIFVGGFRLDTFVVTEVGSSIVCFIIAMALFAKLSTSEELLDERTKRKRWANAGWFWHGIGMSMLVTSVGMLTYVSVGFLPVVVFFVVRWAGLVHYTVLDVVDNRNVARRVTKSVFLVGFEFACGLFIILVDYLG